MLSYVQVVCYSDEGDPDDQLCGVLAWALQSFDTCRVTLDAERLVYIGGGEVQCQVESRTRMAGQPLPARPIDRGCPTLGPWVHPGHPQALVELARRQSGRILVSSTFILGIAPRAFCCGGERADRHTSRPRAAFARRLADASRVELRKGASQQRTRARQWVVVGVVTRHQTS